MFSSIQMPPRVAHTRSVPTGPSPVKREKLSPVLGSDVGQMSVYTIFVDFSRTARPVDVYILIPAVGRRGLAE